LLHAFVSARPVRWILADGKKIYSKKETGRLPSAEEVINLLRSRKPAQTSDLAGEETE